MARIELARRRADVASRLKARPSDPNTCDHRFADGLGRHVLWCSHCGASNFDDQGWVLPSNTRMGS